MTKNFPSWCVLRWMVAALFLFAGEILFAQNAAPTYRTSNRWLLIVETSRAMQPRAETSAQLAGNLVLSGMNGQMRPGDTLGIWTFNDKLHAGEFALQTWTPEKAKELAGRVATFIARQKFENRAARNQIFPAMNNVVSNSEFITVVLITSGAETVVGTPFDKAINTIHAQWRGQQEKIAQPFLTMLRGQSGRLTDFEVGRPPASLEFPPLPAELLVTIPKAPTTVIAPAAPPPPITTGANLIVHGKKREVEAELVSNAPPLVVVITNVPAIELPKTNAVTSATGSITNVIAVTTNPSSLATTNIPTVASAEPPPNRGIFWLASATAGIAGVALVAMLIRRSRGEPRVSLITRSLDRDKR